VPRIAAPDCWLIESRANRDLIFETVFRIRHLQRQA
jgi:hypothetical protein